MEPALLLLHVHIHPFLPRRGCKVAAREVKPLGRADVHENFCACLGELLQSSDEERGGDVRGGGDEGVVRGEASEHVV